MSPDDAAALRAVIDVAVQASRASAITRDSRSWDLPPWIARRDSEHRLWIARAALPGGGGVALEHEDLQALRDLVRALRAHLLVLP